MNISENISFEKTFLKISQNQIITEKENIPIGQYYFCYHPKS